MVPTLVRFGSPEPFSIPMAWRISTAAGGVFVMKVNDRSSNTVISTGIVVPMSFAVWALNALTNSMMLMPCWPRAGPTGGAGDAWPPGAWSLMVVRTFFIRAFRLICGRRAATLDLLHLVVPDLHRRLAPEDGDQDLELARVLVDLGDLAGEIRQRAGDHLHGFADRELSPCRPRDRHLAMEQAIDLGLGQRDRLVGRADEPRDSRRALHDLPGILIEVHVHEHVAGHGPLLDRDLLVVLHLLDRLGRDDDLAHGARLVQGGHTVLEILLDLVLVPGVGVDDVPAKHLSENCLNDWIPDRVERAEVGAGHEHESDGDCGALADLPAIGPLHPLELVPRRAQEVRRAAEDVLARAAPGLDLVLALVLAMVAAHSGRLRSGLGELCLGLVGRVSARVDGIGRLVLDGAQARVLHLVGGQAGLALGCPGPAAALSLTIAGHRGS